MSNRYSTINSRVLVLFMILMTGCQAISPPYKSSTRTYDGSEHQSRHNRPVLEITSGTIKQSNKNTVVYENNVELRWNESIQFLADRISIEYDENGINYIVKMNGNVSMWKSTVLNIKSEEADSSDFSLYVNFAGNVSISDKGYHYKANWVRYYFLWEKFQFKWIDDDIPTRGHRITDQAGYL